MKLILAIIIALPMFNAYTQTTPPDSVKQIPIPHELIQHRQFTDSLYAPLFIKSNNYKTICSNNEVMLLEPVAGIIFNNVSFEHTQTISSSMSMSPKFRPGNQSVLFLHLQPTNSEGITDCDTTNLVIMTEIKLPEQNKQYEVSGNTQLSFFTGVSYYPFSAKPSGLLTINKMDQALYRVKMNLKFTFSDQRYRIIKADYHTRSMD